MAPSRLEARLRTEARRRIRTPWRQARLVTSSLQFFAGELTRRPGVSSYTLRSGEAVLVRHHDEEDAFVLQEIFGEMDSYAVPAAVSRLEVRRIADVGGNIGLATLRFARVFPGASIAVVEADPANAQVLAAAVALNDLTDRVTLHRFAAGTEDGTMRFVGGQGGRSHVAEASEGGVEIPVRDVFPLLAEVDLLKLDIEGGEWPILADARLAANGLKAICLEYHEYMCPAPDPTTEVRRRLEAAGFAIAELREEPPGGVLWATR